MLIKVSYAQQLIKNNCDSTLLSKDEYKKCLLDSVFNDEILLKINYIIKFKTQLLPQFRNIKKSLIVNKNLQNKLDMFYQIYDSVLQEKTYTFGLSMDKNQKYIQPNAYLSNTLSFQLFNFYPDIYAIMLNDIHVQLQPQTSKSNLEDYKKIISKLLKAIPLDLFEKVLNITKAFNNANSKYDHYKMMKPFQGNIDETLKEQYDVINFLIWNK